MLFLKSVLENDRVGYNCAVVCGDVYVSSNLWCKGQKCVRSIKIVARPDTIIHHIALQAPAKATYSHNAFSKMSPE